jgi:hypothetical protein
VVSDWTIVNLEAECPLSARIPVEAWAQNSASTSSEFCLSVLDLGLSPQRDRTLLRNSVTLNHWVVGSIPTRCITQRKRLTLEIVERSNSYLSHFCVEQGQLTHWIRVSIDWCLDAFGFFSQVVDSI